jgi:hypothetical protein
MKFYVYHVTNPDQVVAGTEKPFVEEKGPYAYREARSKIHGNFTEETTFVTYGQVKTYHFDKEKSCENCTKDDVVTVINAPMVGLAYIVQKDPLLGALASILNKAVTKGDYFNLKPPTIGHVYDDGWKDSLFMKATVDGLIFNGVMPGIVKFVIDYKLGLVGPDLPIVIQGTNGGKIHIEYPYGFEIRNEFFEIGSCRITLFSDCLLKTELPSIEKCCHILKDTTLKNFNLMIPFLYRLSLINTFL